MMKSLLKHPAALFFAIILHVLIALLFVISFNINVIDGGDGEVTPIQLIVDNVAVPRVSPEVMESLAAQKQAEELRAEAEELAQAQQEKIEQEAAEKASITAASQAALLKREAEEAEARTKRAAEAAEQAKLEAEQEAKTEAEQRAKVKAAKLASLFNKAA